jgi:GNAT superfamily N-acetyltransferase
MSYPPRLPNLSRLVNTTPGQHRDQKHPRDEGDTEKGDRAHKLPKPVDYLAPEFSPAEYKSDALVGFVLFAQNLKDGKGRESVFVDELLVHGSQRRSGIGRKLLSYAASHNGTVSVERIHLIASRTAPYDGAIAPVEYYRTLGFYIPEDDTDRIANKSKTSLMEGERNAYMVVDVQDLKKALRDTPLQNASVRYLSIAEAAGKMHLNLLGLLKKRKEMLQSEGHARDTAVTTHTGEGETWGIYAVSPNQ